MPKTVGTPVPALPSDLLGGERALEAVVLRSHLVFEQGRWRRDATSDPRHT